MHMEHDGNRPYMDKLFSQDQALCYEALVELKNSVIGSNKQKSNVILQGVVPRLMQFLLEDSTGIEFLVEAAMMLGSVARGTDEHIAALIDCGVIPLMLKGLWHPNQQYVEACVRCLRSILMSPISPANVVYQDETIVPHMIALLPRSSTTKECVTSILADCCRTVDHQTILCNSGAIQVMAPLLQEDNYRVQMPTLKCYAAMCYQNPHVSQLITDAYYNGRYVTDSIVVLLSRDKTLHMQMAAAKCLTYMCRAGAIGAKEHCIMFKALPCLVRMCKRDKDVAVRVAGAETLAYLTEADAELQATASISDHLIQTLADYLKPQLPYHEPSDVRKLDEAERQSKDMVQAAFLAFASISANDEDIRKKIIETEGLMDMLVTGLANGRAKVCLASVRCLHSLSRSVQQLRTSFQDHSVWKPLMKLLHNSPEDILIAASSTLCNLLLEFSPSKEPIMESGAVELLCGLTRRDNPALRLNGIWALMNMAFQAEQKVKSSILVTLGTDQLFRLLADADVNVLMKTLGLLRNLLTTKPVGHIDYIMGVHGKQVMQAVILILEGDHTPEVKEQALCILANIADGNSAKEFVMSNEDVLKKITSYMMHSNVKLQIAATFCISNLIWNEEEGAYERQLKLKEMGVQKLLSQLQNTSDTVLFDKVKTALNQFS